jgi:hypothetical protein
MVMDINVALMVMDINVALVLSIQSQKRLPIYAESLSWLSHENAAKYQIFPFI